MVQAAVRVPPVPQIPRLELPTFKGNNHSSWIARTEQFFRVENTHDGFKVELVPMAMEGMTLHWLKWLMGQFPELRELSVELLRRHGDDPQSIRGLGLKVPGDIS